MTVDLVLWKQSFANIFFLSCPTESQKRMKTPEIYSRWIGNTNTPPTPLTKFYTKIVKFRGFIYPSDQNEQYHTPPHQKYEIWAKEKNCGTISNETKSNLQARWQSWRCKALWSCWHCMGWTQPVIYKLWCNQKKNWLENKPRIQVQGCRKESHSSSLPLLASQAWLCSFRKEVVQTGGGMFPRLTWM